MWTLPTYQWVRDICRGGTFALPIVNRLKCAQTTTQPKKKCILESFGKFRNCQQAVLRKNYISGKNLFLLVW